MLLSLSALTLVFAGEGDNSDSRTYLLNATIEGKSYAAWSEAWWQWAISIKKDRNPVLDKTGAFAQEGQAGPVWFLAGTAGGTVERKCVVPAGKPIFFPVLNIIDNAPPDKADQKKLLAAAKREMDRATGLEVVLDGKPIAAPERFRVQSSIFTFTGPEKPAEALDADFLGKQVAASDGCWIMLKPLSPGKHTLRFKGKLTEEKGEKAFNLSLNVTYELTVEKKQ